MKNACIYYRLFVLVQVGMFIFAITVFAFVPDSRPKIKMHWANSHIGGGLKVALEMFKVDYGRYPTTSEGLGVLVSVPTNDSLMNYKGPYLDGTPEDPWGHPYVYRSPAVHSTYAYDLYSLGPDGISRSGGNDSDDVANWEKPWSPGFTSEDLIIIALLIIAAIPFLLIIRLITAAISSRFRILVEQNRLADRVWLVTAVIVFLIALLMPKISG